MFLPQHRLIWLPATHSNRQIDNKNRFQFVSPKRTIAFASICLARTEFTICVNCSRFVRIWNSSFAFDVKRWRSLKPNSVLIPALYFISMKEIISKREIYSYFIQLKFPLKSSRFRVGNGLGRGLIRRGGLRSAQMSYLLFWFGCYHCIFNGNGPVKRFPSAMATERHLPSPCFRFERRERKKTNCQAFFDMSDDDDDDDEASDNNSNKKKGESRLLVAAQRQWQWHMTY